MIPLAHGLTVGRQDLPIPDWLFAWGASLVLIVSFVALSLAWRRARFEDDRWRPVADRLSRALLNPATGALAGAIGVFLLGLTIYAGVAGTQEPDRNFAVTFVFVTVWLGFVAFSIVLGDVFRAFNPWRAVARAIGGVFRLVAGQQARPPLRYPERLGRWPAAVGVAAFVWFELVYGVGFQAVGLTPEDVAVAAIAYSAYTFAAMVLFGTETWLQRGELFSVYFNMFSRFSALEVRDGRLGVRRPLSGLVGWAAVPGSIALVLFTIGGAAFDGAQEGALKGVIEWLFDRFGDAGLSSPDAFRVAQTVIFAAVLAAISAIYWGGVLGMHTVRGSRPTSELARLFIHGFIPIAFAYLIAHYFSLFAFQEQAQFTFLLSDPLGDGLDLFGTAASGVDYGLIGANAVWYVQVGVLVGGHVTALMLGHDRAITVYGDARAATRSQYWMLALMVAFTTLGLFLLSQSNA